VLESEGGGMKSDNRTQLGQLVNEKGPKDNGFDDEVVVNNIPEAEEEVVEGNEEVIGFFHDFGAPNSHNVERLCFEGI